jgi:quercetin dioxygenase-like cupin family protein
MKITRYKDQQIKNTPHKIDVREMYNKETTKVMLMALNPGEGVPSHKTPDDVFFYILEGSPTIHVGDESEVCTVDTLVESPGGSLHGISNNSDSLARVLVVKTGRPV